MNRDGIVWVVLVFLAVAMAVPVATACDEDCENAQCIDKPFGYREMAVYLDCGLSISGTIDSFSAGQTVVGCTARCKYCTNPRTPPTGSVHVDKCSNIYPEVEILSFCLDTSAGIPWPPIQRGVDYYYLEGGGRGDYEVRCTPVGCQGEEVTRNSTPITFHFVFTVIRSKSSWFGPIGDDPSGEIQPTWRLCDCTEIENKTVSQSTAFISGPVSNGICTSEQLATCLSGVSCNNVTVSQ